MSTTPREPAGCMRPGITLSFEQQAAAATWKGLKAKDRCAPLSPIGKRVLRAHLESQTEHQQPIEDAR